MSSPQLFLRACAVGRRMIVALILLLSTGATASLAESLRLTGRLVDDAQVGVAEAQLTLYPMGSPPERARRLLDGAALPEAAAAATSGGAGWFAIDAPAPGFWTLRVEAAGFGPVEEPVAALVESRDLGLIVLGTDDGLAVRVLGVGGRPAGDVPVAVRPAERQFRGSELAEQWARTDESGIARVPWVAGVAAELAAWLPGGGVARASDPGTSSPVLELSSRLQRLRVFDDRGQPVAGALAWIAGSGWPLGTTDDEGRMTVAIDDDERLKIVVLGEGGYAKRLQVGGSATGEQAVDLVPPTRLVGEVRDGESGTGLDGVVWTSRDGGQWSAPARAGRFDLAVPAAGSSANVFAAAPRYLSGSEYVAVRPNGGFDSIHLSLSMASGVRGVVVDGDGQPIAGARIGISVPRDAMIRMTPRRAQRSLTTPWGAPVTDERGRFENREMLAGFPYDLQVVALGFAGRRLEVAPLERGELRSVRVALVRGGVAAGRVVSVADGSPVVGATVALLPESMSGRSIPWAIPLESAVWTGTTGETGDFEAPGMASGVYALQIESAGFARLFRSVVELAEAQSRWDLGVVELAAEAPIRGRVLGPGRESLAGAAVLPVPGNLPLFVLDRMCGERLPAEQLTGADGSFELSGLAAGTTINLVACHDDFPPGYAKGVTAPTRTSREIVLSAAAEIAGRVVDGEGRGLAGASVALEVQRRRAMYNRPSSSETSETDEEGRFLLDRLSATPGTLVATAPGRVTGRLAVEPIAGERLEEVVITLEAGATVSGRVERGDGSPAPEAWVSIDDLGLTSSADAVGRFRLEGVPAGSYQIRARDDDWQTAVEELAVEPGENEIVLRFEPGVRVAGRVVDDAGAPIPGAQLELRQPGSGAGRNGMTDVAGDFELTGVPAGRYSVSVSKERFGVQTYEEGLEVGVAPLTGLLYELARGAKLTGRLLGLEPAASTAIDVYAVGPGRSHVQGQNLGDGTYRVEGLGNGGWRVSGRSHETGEQAEVHVEIVPGASREVADLDFDAGFELSGVVLDWNGPVSGAEIWARGQDVSSRRQVMSDGEGRFSIRGLHEGSYTVSASDPVSGRGATETVEVRADRQVTLELVRGSISGFVTSSRDGAPIATGEVEAEPVDGDDAFGAHLRARTDGAGYFRIDGLAGPVRLHATAPGHGRETIEVDVPEEGSREVELELAPTEGLVLDITSTDRLPSSIYVAVRDAGGLAVFEESFGVPSDGRVRVDRVPAGSWTVAVTATDRQRTSTSAVVPGPAATVRLERGVTLELIVPELEAEAAVPTIHLVGPDGRPYRPFYDRWPEWTLRQGRKTFTGLPPGFWRVAVETTDGRGWSGTATLEVGRAAELRLR